MSHIDALCEDLVRDLCCAAGIRDVNEVVSSRHMAIGDRVIGLIPELACDAPTLSVYIELGLTHPDQDGALYARMLAWNVAAPATALGHYGIHPETHQAVYCLRLELEGLNGEPLAALLESQMQVANDAMKELATQTHFDRPPANGLPFFPRPY